MPHGNDNSDEPKNFEALVEVLKRLQPPGEEYGNINFEKMSDTDLEEYKRAAVISLDRNQHMTDSKADEFIGGLSAEEQNALQEACIAFEFRNRLKRKLEDAHKALSPEPEPEIELIFPATEVGAAIRDYERMFAKLGAFVDRLVAEMHDERLKELLRGYAEEIKEIPKEARRSSA